MRALVYALTVAVAAAAVMVLNTAAWTASTDYADMGGYRRLWSDLALAVNAFLDARHPPTSGEEAARAAARDAVEAYRPLIVERTQRGDIRPATPWRTMGVRPFLRERAQREAQLYDDPGRALLLSAGFRVLGSVAPFLILWLGLLVALPVLGWLVAEGFAAGHGPAVSAMALALCCWPFFLETLALPRYAVGFYLVAVLGLCAFALALCLGALTPGGLLARATAAGLLLALCAVCRSSVILLLPGFVLALLVGLRRVAPRWPGRVGILALPALIALAAPYLFVQPAQRHGVWSAVWEGLGDFDRTHGHAWSDPVAEQVSRDAGGGALWTPGSEAVFRRVVIGDVRGDPAWYAGILVKRAGATLVQWKLWPRRAAGGSPIRRSTSDNEGFMDKYYGYAATADHVGLGRWRVELPMVMMLAPPLLLVALALRGPARAEARRALPVLACVAVATLGVPLAISTAAAQETQAFAFVYVLALGFVVELAWRFPWRFGAEAAKPRKPQGSARDPIGQPGASAGSDETAHGAGAAHGRGRATLLRCADMGQPFKSRV